MVATQNRVHDGGLTDARPARDHHYLRFQGGADGLDLAAREGEASLLLDPGQRLVCVNLGPGEGAGPDPLDLIRWIWSAMLRSAM